MENKFLKELGIELSLETTMDKMISFFEKRSKSKEKLDAIMASKEIQNMGKEIFLESITAAQTVLQELSRRDGGVHTFIFGDHLENQIKAILERVRLLTIAETIGLMLEKTIENDSPIDDNALLENVDIKVVQKVLIAVREDFAQMYSSLYSEEDDDDDEYSYDEGLGLES